MLGKVPIEITFIRERLAKKVSDNTISVGTGRGHKATWPLCLFNCKKQRKPNYPTALYLWKLHICSRVFVFDAAAKMYKKEEAKLGSRDVFPSSRVAPKESPPSPKFSFTLCQIPSAFNAPMLGAPNGRKKRFLNFALDSRKERKNFLVPLKPRTVVLVRWLMQEKMCPVFLRPKKEKVFFENKTKFWQGILGFSSLSSPVYFWPSRGQIPQTKNGLSTKRKHARNFRAWFLNSGTFVAFICWLTFLAQFRPPIRLSIKRLRARLKLSISGLRGPVFLKSKPKSSLQFILQKKPT